MIRKALALGGPLLVALAIFAMPGVGQAQPRGGGGFGGGRGGGGGPGMGFGGGHFGGGPGMGFGGGPGMGFGGGPHFGGGFYGGGYPGYGYNHYGYGGYHPYGGYSTYPSYGYSSYPYSAYVYPSDGSISTYSSGYYSPSVGVTPATQSDNSAHVTVNVPADAQVLFDGSPTTSTGPVRQFTSPSLEPGKSFTYKVEARWNENGREMNQTQSVSVTAGSHVNVNFPMMTPSTGE